MTEYLNKYYCPECDQEWWDIWTSSNDDRCPSCHISYTPVKSQILDSEEDIWEVDENQPNK